LEGLSHYYNAAMWARFEGANFPFQDNLWVLLARSRENLEIQGLQPIPPPMFKKLPARMWTDDYSDIISLLY
jgi:hypothetical protein